MTSGIVADRAAWRIERRPIIVHGASLTLRLVRFETGWLASVDTVSGPTLGADRSLYLAAARALDPLGVGIAEALTLVGPVAP